MKKPEIFIVGFQKCGSSSLADLLGQHPQIELSFPKETFYLSDKSYDNYNFDRSVDNPNIDWSKFYNSDSQDKIWLEASVCNFYQEKALDYISSIHNSKVIFILRNPIDRLWSTYKYYGRNDLKLASNLSFDNYIDHIHKGIYNSEGMKYGLEHGNFNKYICNWSQQIGDERILIVGLKPLIKDTFGEMQRICNFLEIEPMYKAIKFPNKNISTKVRWPKLNKKIYNLIGGKGFNKSIIARFYNSINKDKFIEKPNDSVRKKYEEYYAKEFEIYSKYF